MKLTYTDTNHRYYLDGKRATSVTAVAKIPTERFTLEQWAQRQVAIGLAVDPNLLENVASDIENRDALNAIVKQAHEAAKAHRAADRGKQMHRVLELVLLDREHKLLTDQQRRDAELLKRTLDRYRLRIFDSLSEQFVAWPHYTVVGRFDAVLEKEDGTLVLTDLKTGPNAIAYPHATAVQLALYARAPFISDAINLSDDKSIVVDWRQMPSRLELRYAYVLLAQPDAEIGTLHEIDIQHGWAAASKALELINWRRELDYGKGMVRDVLAPLTLIEEAAIAPTMQILRELWKEARATGVLTAEFDAIAKTRAAELKVSA